MTTAYDRVRYPNWPNTRTHPGAFGAIARLLGRPAAPFSACRVLEVACSEGVNIGNLAVCAPRSEFVGIDVAETAIAHGRETAALAGLSNLDLRVADIRDPNSVSGQFDYIIAHGVYSWVPDDVRAALMKLVADRLAPQGVAFISYNAYPGCRIRQTIRDYLGYALAGIDDPQERMQAARAALEYQISGWKDRDHFAAALIESASGILRRPTEVLFHDEMGEAWAPQFLSEVAAAAGAHGLAYLADAYHAALADALFPSVRFEAALPQSRGDWTRFEQLVDFTDMRPFRWSLFVRDDGPIDRIATPDRVVGLWASAQFERVAARQDTKAHVFKAANGGEFETDDAGLAGLCEAIAAGPAYPLDEIADKPDLVEAVLRLYVGGLIELSTAAPAYTLTPGDRPAASPLARAQAARGDVVLAGLHHKPARLSDPALYEFLQSCDGGRTRADLARLVVEQHGREAREAAEMVDGAVAAFAASRLLVS